MPYHTIGHDVSFRAHPARHPVIHQRNEVWVIPKKRNWDNGTVAGISDKLRSVIRMHRLKDISYSGVDPVCTDYEVRFDRLTGGEL